MYAQFFNWEIWVEFFEIVKKFYGFCICAEKGRMDEFIQTIHFDRSQGFQYTHQFAISKMKRRIRHKNKISIIKI